MMVYSWLVNNSYWRIFSFTQSTSSFLMVWFWSSKIKVLTWAPIFSINSTESSILLKGTCMSLWLEPTKTLVPSKSPWYLSLINCFPINPPVNAITPPYFLACWVAYSNVRHAPWENPIKKIWSDLNPLRQSPLCHRWFWLHWKCRFIAGIGRHSARDTKCFPGLWAKTQKPSKARWS